VKRLFLILIGALGAIAQPVQQVHPNPDCQFYFTLTAAGSAPTNPFNNLSAGCTTWAMIYSSTGFSGLSLALQSAANSGGAPGSFSNGLAVQQTVVAGSNPSTSTTGGFLWVQGTNAFERVTLSGLTGTGTVNGAVFGWRIPNAAPSSSSAIICLTGDVAAGSGSGCTTATVQGLETVPFCTGYSPSNGQVVEYTTGSSPNPCYSAATPSSGGSIEAHTASNSATLNFTSCISATYDTYTLQIVQLVPATQGATLLMRVSTNGGSSYDSGAHYDWSRFGWTTSGTGVTGTDGDTSITLAPAVDNAANWSVAGTLTLSNPGGGSLSPSIAGQTWGHDAAAADLLTDQVSGWYVPTTAVNAFQFLFSTGNITSGTIRCYGVAH
jgi:hypothetical protein